MQQHMTSINLLNREENMNFYQSLRLKYIDYHVNKFNSINRSDLMEYFGISMPKASQDIQYYINLTKNNIEYDKSKKVYVKKESFNPLFLFQSIDWNDLRSDNILMRKSE